MGVYCGRCEHGEECGEHPERFLDCQDNAARFDLPVWVVAWESNCGGGGFEWRPSIEDALREYDERMSDPQEWGQAVYFAEWYPEFYDRDAITDEIDEWIWAVLPDDRPQGR